jgi:peptide deformylase
MVPEIVTVHLKKDEKFLRKKTVPFDFKKFTKKEINDLVIRMKRIMHAANGIGLSANQIGLDFAVFVAEVPDMQGGMKFYAVFNPKIEKVDKEKIHFEEGCLSIPGKWGEVERAEQIVVSGFNKMGKPVKVKAWGLLSRIFQHEIDHLSGKLFIDRAKKVYTSEQIS